MKRILLLAATLAVLTVSAQGTKSRTTYISTHQEAINTQMTAEPNVRMSRLVLKGYNTICLPFAMTAEEVAATFGADARLEKPAGSKVEGNDLVLYFADCTQEGLEAGKPYLLNSPKATYANIHNTTGVSLDAPCVSVFTDQMGNVVTFQGSFTRLEPNGTWAIPACEGTVPANIMRCDGSRILNPTRCFFVWENQQGADRLSVCHLRAGEEVTGINAVAFTNAENTTYNLGGQRVAQDRGLLIRSGKKVLK